VALMPVNTPLKVPKGVRLAERKTTSLMGAPREVREPIAGGRGPQRVRAHSKRGTM
jgi:hypothetical protein